MKKKESKAVDKVASIVLAGGQGTRLYPLTLARCKPAVSFGGRYRLIDIPLSNSINSGINHLFVISQYLASSLQQHILATYQLDMLRAGTFKLICPEESSERKVWFNGTADAVRQNMGHLVKCPVDYFLILSGDQLYNMDFTDILNFAKSQDADLVIASLPVCEEDAKRMGLLKINHQGLVTDFCEKPQDPKVLKKFEFHEKQDKTQNESTNYLGSMGIYVFKRSTLMTLLQEPGDDFGKDLIPLQVKRGKSFAFVFEGYWEDIGTVKSYYHANLALTKNKNCLDMYDENHPIFTCHHNLPSPAVRNAVIHDSLISQGSIIEASEITNSIIGIRSLIKKGSVVKNSIVLGNHFYHPPYLQSPPLPEHFHIGENCLIEKAIIDEHTLIGNNVQLTNKHHLEKYDGDGIYIRDGIIIVTAGARLPNGFVL